MEPSCSLPGEGRHRHCDLKLVGGQVIDGTGTPPRRADVAVTGGVIAAVGDLGPLPATVTVDCTNKIVTPGFIDIHSHADWLLPGADHGDLVEPFIRQGMTTLVGGNCGFSPAPISDVNRSAAHEASRLIIDGVIDLRWETMGEFLDALTAGGVSINVAQLVGHGTVRGAVSGPLTPAPPTPDELAAMERLTRAALDAGCVGVSSGLGYPPGIFAQEEELAHFARWAAAADKLFGRRRDNMHLRPVESAPPPHLNEWSPGGLARGCRADIEALAGSWRTDPRTSETPTYLDVWVATPHADVGPVPVYLYLSGPAGALDIRLTAASRAAPPDA